MDRSRPHTLGLVVAHRLDVDKVSPQPRRPSEREWFMRIIWARGEYMDYPNTVASSFTLVPANAVGCQDKSRLASKLAKYAQKPDTELGATVHAIPAAAWQRAGLEKPSTPLPQHPADADTPMPPVDKRRARKASPRLATPLAKQPRTAADISTVPPTQPLSPSLRSSASSEYGGSEFLDEDAVLAYDRHHYHRIEGRPPPSRRLDPERRAKAPGARA